MPALGVEESETFWYKIQKMRKLLNVITFPLEKDRLSEAVTFSLVWESLLFSNLTKATSFRYLQDGVASLCTGFLVCACVSLICARNRAQLFLQRCTFFSGHEGTIHRLYKDWNYWNVIGLQIFELFLTSMVFLVVFIKTHLLSLTYLKIC